MHKQYFITFILVCLLGSLQAQNILISNSWNPNEPSIIIDPKKPNRLVAGTNTDYVGYSLDTGRTWVVKEISSTYGVWGDPVISVDTSGDFYYFHLSQPPAINRIVCQKSTDNGATWNNGTYTGLSGTKQQDKEWCAVDRKTNTLYLTWTQFDDYGSSNPLDSSVIMFSKSTNGGATWSTAKRISQQAGDCVDDDKTVEGAVPAIGPNGEVYVSWASEQGIMFTKSTDGGDTWLPETFITSMPGGWNYDISGIFRANGLPITLCDLSGGVHNGTIYINWTDQRNGVTDTDVWLIKSTDGGDTWSAPIKVNDDTSHRQQFFTWATIDQANGNLHFVFYDRRNHIGDSTDVYLAHSVDGGNTFINHKISQMPFLPASAVFFGDYTNITAHNGIVRPIWTRMNNGQLSVWTDISINQFSPTNIDEPNTMVDNLEFENYPNPSGHYTFVSFKLRKNGTVNCAIYDTQGNMVAKVIENEKRSTGKYIERICLDDLNIKPGIYYIKLNVDGEMKINRQIKY